MGAVTIFSTVPSKANSPALQWVVPISTARRVTSDDKRFLAMNPCLSQTGRFSPVPLHAAGLPEFCPVPSWKDAARPAPWTLVRARLHLLLSLVPAGFGPANRHVPHGRRT